jgi:hypothetical protein
MKPHSRQIWLTETECDLAHRVFSMVACELNNEVNDCNRAYSFRKLALMWTRDEVLKIRDKFAPKEEIDGPQD